MKSTIIDLLKQKTSFERSITGLTIAEAEKMNKLFTLRYVQKDNSPKSIFLFNKSIDDLPTTNDSSPKSASYHPFRLNLEVKNNKIVKSLSWY
jgi:hypothetical protein